MLCPYGHPMTPLFISWVCDQCDAAGPTQELTIDQVFNLPLGTRIKILRLPSAWTNSLDLVGWCGEFVRHHNAWMVLEEPDHPIRPKVHLDSTAPYARELRFSRAP